MSEKHTPGPYRIETPFGRDDLSIVAGPPDAQVYEWRIIATVHTDRSEGGHFKPISRQEARANAERIVAALTALDAKSGSA